MKPAEKYLPLESLRGIAALGVAIFHYRTASPLTDNPLIQSAYLGVDLFFVVSGFVIALNYTDRIASWAAARAFYIRRFWRLYPLHLTMLLVFVGIEAAKLVFERATGIAANHPAFGDSNAAAFLANLLMLQSPLLDRPTFNHPSWSISTEMLAYLAFAGLALAARRFLALAFCALMLAAGAALYFADGDFSAMYGPRATLRCLYSFSLGVLTCAAHKAVRLRFGSAWALTAGAAALVLMTTTAGTEGEVLAPLAFAVFVLLLSRLKPGIAAARVMSSRPFVWLGTMSYSIYMLHVAVWWVLDKALRFGLGAETVVDKAGRTVVALGPAEATIATLGGLAVLLGLSAITYRLIENRFRRGWPPRIRSVAAST